MRHSASKMLFFGLFVFALLLYIGTYNATIVNAQIPVNDTDFVNDGVLYVYASLDGTNLKTSGEDNPLEMPVEVKLVPPSYCAELICCNRAAPEAKAAAAAATRTHMGACVSAKAPDAPAIISI